MLGDISYHKATLQSEGKHSVHYLAEVFLKFPGGRILRRSMVCTKQLYACPVEVQIMFDCVYEMLVIKVIGPSSSAHTDSMGSKSFLQIYNFLFLFLLFVLFCVNYTV